MCKSTSWAFEWEREAEWNQVSYLSSGRRAAGRPCAAPRTRTGSGSRPPSSTPRRSAGTTPPRPHKPCWLPQESERPKSRARRTNQIGGERAKASETWCRSWWRGRRTAAWCRQAPRRRSHRRWRTHPPPPRRSTPTPCPAATASPPPLRSPQPNAWLPCGWLVRSRWWWPTVGEREREREHTPLTSPPFIPAGQSWGGHARVRAPQWSGVHLSASGGAQVIYVDTILPWVTASAGEWWWCPRNPGWNRLARVARGFATWVAYLHQPLLFFSLFFF